MKLGIFVVAALCAGSMTARADAGQNHERTIEEYRRAYELESDPRLLVQIAREYRRAGNAAEALAYFCSYMYVDAAGEHADEASIQARALAAQLGRPATSDHEACTAKSAAKPVAAADPLAVPAQPPRISKREIAGLGILVAGLTSIGFAIRDGRELTRIHIDQKSEEPSTDLDTLARRESALSLRHKVLLGVGSATVITGGILYVIGRIDRRKADRALIAPTVSKGGAGFVLTRPF